MSRPSVLHPHTEANVAQFVEQPSHAVLLMGSNGVGKTYLAEHILADVLQLDEDRLNSHPYYTVVRPEKGSISIDAVRELQRFLQLKTLGTKPFRRAVIVEHAEGLTIEAQNAFLKLLEEPPADTIMILTADTARALLPTILSRVQTIAVQAPDDTTLKAYFASQGKEATAITQAYFLSGGLPGLMHALLAGDETHPLLAGVATAKTILQAQTFERLALVEGMSKQKDEAKYTLQALRHIAQTGLDQAAAKADPAKIKQWHHILKVTTAALDSLALHANTKLTLSNLMLHI